MKINANKNEINILIEESEEINIEDFITYIQKYNERKIIVSQDNQKLQIDFEDIIVFYSDKKYNKRTEN